jgi:hypothetical protein
MIGLEIKLNDTVYYDPRTNSLFSIKTNEENTVIITGETEFLRDGITNVLRYRISKEYLEGCKIIDKTSPLVEKYFFSNSFPNDFSYKLKGENHKSFYNNKNFEYLNEETNKAQKEWFAIIYPYGEPDDWPDDYGDYEEDFCTSYPEGTEEIFYHVEDCVKHLREILVLIYDFQRIFIEE